MTILALAGIDGVDLPYAALRDVCMADRVDVIVCAGDILPPGRLSHHDACQVYARFLDGLGTIGVPAVIVPGCQDVHGDVLRRVAAEGRAMCCLVPPDGGALSFGPLLVGSVRKMDPAGGDGAGVSDDALDALRRYNGPRVLVVHPQGSGMADRQEAWRVMRQVIDDLHVPLVLYGHARDGQGQERIGGSVVVNPGPLSNGRYAIGDPHDGTIRFGILPRRSNVHRSAA